MDISGKNQSNKSAWNEAASFYGKELEESVAFLKNGGKHFCRPELKFLKDLESWCHTAVHLQCAAGHDTLSLINLGAKKVIGVDISDKMIELAREKSRRLNMNAEWINADVLDLPKKLDGVADLVYTGRGALNWIMNIDVWAKAIFRTLKEGGRLYVFEGHPMTFFFDMSKETLQLDLEFEGYFSEKIYCSQDWPKSYIKDLSCVKDEFSKKYEKLWPISKVINALTNVGLQFGRFEEHPDKFWEEFPFLKEEDRTKFPNTFSLLMFKTANILNKY